MTKLTERERVGFEKILEEDLRAINVRFMQQIKDFWGVARNEIIKKKGWDKLIAEKNDLEIKKSEIVQRIHDIEKILNSEELRVEQIVELGGKPNEYGKHRGAMFYGIPIESQFEYEIVEYVRNNIDIEIPSKILRDICSSSIRALTMVGTFEEARTVYDKFYSLNFREFGVDIPPRLEEICNDRKMVDYTQHQLNVQRGVKQIEEKKPATHETSPQKKRKK